MDINKVITLGHMVRQPLIRLSSELVDRLEPHGHKPQYVGAGVGTGSAGRWGGVYPGGADRVGTREGYTGYPAEASFDAYLMNLVVYLVHTAV